MDPDLRHRARMRSGAVATTMAVLLSAFAWVPASAIPRCDIWGTPKDDVIVGTPGFDRICALAGDDIIRGKGGGDVIWGHGGNDVIYGGDGDDLLYARDGRKDIVRGGSGDDAAKVDGSLDWLKSVERVR